MEDSANGIRSAAAAEMKVIAVPNREFPPSPAELALADEVLSSLQELDRARVEWVAAGSYGATPKRAGHYDRPRARRSPPASPR